jgi:hypothetical protein
MRYRVNFRKRFDVAGKTEERPVASLSLSEGLVRDAVIVEPPEARVDEADDFLRLGTEAWVFIVAPGRDEEFVYALKNSRATLAYEVLGKEAA